MGTCPACGEAATGDSLFCAHCGARLGEAPVVDAPYPAPAAEPPPPPPPSSPPVGFPGAEPHPGDLASTADPVAPRRSGSVPVPAVVAVVAVLLALAAVLLASAGGGDGGSASDGPTTTFAPLVTSPTLTDEEFVVDMLASDENISPLMVEEEHRCFARSMVTAMGGAAALRAAGISPEQLTEPFGLRGEEVPADAIDVFLATGATCGLDLADVIFFRPLSIELGEDTAACVAAGLDRAALGRLLATFFLDPQRSDMSFVPTRELRQQFRAVEETCL